MISQIKQYLSNGLKNKRIINFILISLILISSIGICYADSNVDKNELANPLGITSIPELIGKIIKGALGIVGSLSLIMFIYGGLTWMTSGGSEDKIKKGKQILVWAVCGIIVIFTSYSILKLVFEILE